MPLANVPEYARQRFVARRSELDHSGVVLFRLKLFGGASIDGPAGPVTGRAAQRRRLAMLALLATARARGLSRDKLIAYLWPESDVERARHLLSDSVYRINQAVGGEAVFAVGDELRLNPERLPSDVWDFLDAIDRHDWQAAVDLHTSPFLDGFFLTGADEFERWVSTERERCAHERARALETLAREAETEPAVAVRWWRMLAADSPYSSRIALELMRAHERAGDRAAAVQHARVHAVLLREEIGVEPDPELLAYADRLRLAGQEYAPPAATGREPPGAEVRTPGPADEAAQAGARVTSAVGAQPGSRRADDPPAWRGHVQRRAALTIVAATALALLALLLDSLTGPRVEVPAPASSTAIAVMPFADLSPSGDHEYFADGITEELIVRLSKVTGLRVVGRSSVFAFKGRATPAPEIGSRLGVSAILDGSVRREHDRLRITAQLVDAASGYELWSETYEREARDVLAIQDEIARAIVTRLRGRLAGEQQTSTPAPPIDDPEAYNLYLRGRFEWHKRTEQGLRNAVDYFARAVARAPEHARAHVGLGDAYAVLGFYDYLPPHEAFPRAKAAAQAALRLDPTLGGPHATLGYVALYHDWEWERAEAEFLRAIELDPGYSTGHQWYANFLTAMGRFNEAVRAMRAAQDLDPLSLIANAALGWVLYYAGEYDRAIDQLGRTLELSRDFELAYLWRGLALEQLGQLAQARVNLERAVELSGGSAISTVLLARTHAVAGDRERALDMLRGLERRNTYLPAFEIAKVYEALGDRTGALRWLRRAHEERSHSMAFLMVDPQLQRLRDDPEFDRLVRATGLDRRPVTPR